LAIFFLLPNKKFHSEFSCWKLLPKNRRNKEKNQLDVCFSDVFSLPVHFQFLESSLTVTFGQVCLPVKETAEMKQKWQKSPCSWDQAKTMFGLEIERKLAKLSKTTFTYRSSS
jgi:hypothetical protein